MEIRTESQYTEAGEISTLEKLYIWPVVIIAGILWLIILGIRYILSIFINLKTWKNENNKIK